jgi:hypothetical protein
MLQETGGLLKRGYCCVHRVLAGLVVPAMFRVWQSEHSLIGWQFSRMQQNMMRHVHHPGQPGAIPCPAAE